MKPSPPPTFMRWFGRQVGHVKKAIRAQVGRQVVYRQNKVEEHPHPDDPNITLRRTTTDEVIVRRYDDGQGV